MTTDISIIVPTIGRASLARALASITPQLGPGDEVIVVADSSVGDTDATRRTAQAFPDSRWRYAEIASDATGIGTAQRNYGMLLATGTHLAFLDDDDEYTPDALQAFRQHAAGVPVIFRMQHPTQGLLWRTQSLTYGNVGTPMFLVPNQPARLGRWRAYTADGRGADFAFISDTILKNAAAVWREEIVCRVSQVGSRIAA